MRWSSHVSEAVESGAGRSRAQGAWGGHSDIELTSRSKYGPGSSEVFGPGCKTSSWCLSITRLTSWFTETDPVEFAILRGQSRSDTSLLGFAEGDSYPLRDTAPCSKPDRRQRQTVFG